MKPTPCPNAAEAAARPPRRRCAAAVLAGLVGLLAGAQALAQPAAERRLALVIGNANYAQGPLRSPVQDARAVARALRELGFEVTLQENARLDAMMEALREFSAQARQARVRVVYYAGHGFQLRGRNYLVPTDAELNSEAEVRAKTADVGDLVDRLRSYRDGLDIVILDACRTPPFLDKLKLATRAGTGPAPGLAAAAVPQGALVAYSTSPGAVAQDGGTSHSVYARHLLAHIATPGLPVEQLFKRVRTGVAQETGNAQIPWEASSLTGDFCFKPGASGNCTPLEIDAAAAPAPGSAGEPRARALRR
jgi:uncharacterized caspase-like protein